jgi:hypothetical protein
MSTVTIPNLPAAGALTGTEVLPIVQSNTTSKTTVQAIANLAGLPYKVYTALLTQSGGDSLESQGIGLLTVGVTYYIYDIYPGTDFTNVGAPNNDIGTYFVATGTTPNSWGDVPEGNSVLQYNTGAPVVTVLENTIGNIWFTYIQDGYYRANSIDGFTLDKTFCQGITSTAEDGTGLTVITVRSNNIDTVNIYSTNPINEVPFNGALLNTPIEIRVYN